jgi:hypothetical protein
VTDRKSGKQVSVTTPGKDMAEIAPLVTKAQSFQSINEKCRDCFQYGLLIQRNKDQVLVKADDMTLTESGLGPLVTILSRLINQALSGQLNSS